MQIARYPSVSFALLLSVLCLVAADASGFGVTYSYDPTGRVAAAIYDSGMCVAYSYDAAGNRTAQSNVATTTAAWGSRIWGCFNWTP